MTTIKCNQVLCSWNHEKTCNKKEIDISASSECLDSDEEKKLL